MLRYALIAFLFFSFINDINAQAKLGNWQAYFMNASLGESAWSFQGDVQHRDHNLFGDLDQIIIRPGIQYTHAPSNSSYLMGYSYFIYQNEGDPNVTVTENRIFQDIDLRQSIGRVGIRHRYRFEERFVENTPFAFRMRYAIFVNIPINNQKLEANTFYLPFWNEVFINAKGTPFDRNWLYGGLGYKFTQGIAMQFGAMNQFRSVGPKAQLVLSLHHQF